MLKTILIFISTVIATTLLISIVSSQIILADLQSFGLEISFNKRLCVAANDIVGLGPILMLMLGLSFLVAFPIAKYAHKFLGGNNMIWTIIAGFSSFPTTLFIIKYFIGITILSSARTSTGMILIAICCALGGYLYSILNSKYRKMDDA